MRYRIKVKDLGTLSEWWEEYEKNVPDARDQAKKDVEFFNSTLRPGEHARELLEVEVLDTESVRDHEWRKTNLVTVMKKGRHYDTYECTRCGITGKRLGVNEIVVDPEFSKAKAYRRCDTALKHLKKKGNP